MTYFQFSKKVVEDEYRPVFDVPIKKSLRELTERCWSAKPEKRPTFEELFNKLAYRSKEWIIDIYEGKETEDEYATDKYFLEGVDAVRVENYVESITERAQNEPRPPESGSDSISEIKNQLARLEQENEELKRQIAELKAQNKDAAADDVAEMPISSSQASESNEKAEITPQIPSFVRDSINSSAKYDKTAQIIYSGDAIKVVLVGAPFVGKTSIINRIIYRDIYPDCRPTINSAFSNYKATLNSIEIDINIWDTAGMERYRSINMIYYRNVDAAIAIYDQTDLHSAESIISHVDDVKSVSPNSYICIVANKDDLPNKIVSLVEMQIWCEKQGFGFVVASAKTGSGIDDIVQTILNKIKFEKSVKKPKVELNDSEIKEKHCC